MALPPNLHTLTKGMCVCTFVDLTHRLPTPPLSSLTQTSGVKPCCSLGWTADVAASLLPPGPGLSYHERKELLIKHHYVLVANTALLVNWEGSLQSIPSPPLLPFWLTGPPSSPSLLAYCLSSPPLTFWPAVPPPLRSADSPSSP